MSANTTPLQSPGELWLFQDAFEHALWTPDAEPGAAVAALTAQPGFAVYRNTVMTACIDALQANYPAVAALAGERRFNAAATAYVRQSPPTDAVLMRYGAGFAGFLSGFTPAMELPYLPDVARLDRFWTEAHLARDDHALDAAQVAAFSADTLASTRLRPHASARWAWFAHAPVFTIWSRARLHLDYAHKLEWKPEGALVVRPRDTVRWIAIDIACHAFMEACALGHAAGEAACAALEARSDADLAALMRTLLGNGAFSQLSLDTSARKSNHDS